VQKLTKDLRRRTKRPLVVKLTPNVTDITVIAKAAQEGGADAVSCINTLVGMVIDVAAKKPVLPLGPAGCRACDTARWRRHDLCGEQSGFDSRYRHGRHIFRDDALQYLLAGASAIQIGTANFVDPSTASSILAGIRSTAKRKKFPR